MRVHYPNATADKASTAADGPTSSAKHWRGTGLRPLATEDTRQANNGSALDLGSVKSQNVIEDIMCCISYIWEGGSVSRSAQKACECISVSSVLP